MYNNLTKHGFLMIAAGILLAMFLFFVYLCDHQSTISDNEQWIYALTNSGISKSDIEKLTHDDSMWFYNGISTCVGYSGDENDKCSRFESVCSNNDRFGTFEDQARNIKYALEKNGVHPRCPLIYDGAD